MDARYDTAFVARERRRAQAFVARERTPLATGLLEMVGPRGAVRA